MIGLLMLSRNILFQQTMQYSRGGWKFFQEFFHFLFLIYYNNFVGFGE